MKITDLQVDGYGVLADLRIENVSPGLTVFYGPNEAGKSTLLDFIRGMLFGFPDRRARRGFHAPLRGGRHGGALGLLDEEGQRYLLERHVGTRAPNLSDQSGAALAPEDLDRLLGRANDVLFDSVFAFGLGELSRFETLDRDEVRDVVFSAGVLGAGRSASRAARALEAKRTNLVRPRQQDALANQLRRRLDDVEAELRARRAAAQAYPQAAACLDHLSLVVRDTRQSADLSRARATELSRLIDRWPTWHRRQLSAVHLGQLGALSVQDKAVLSQEGEIATLSAEYSGYEERTRLRELRERQLLAIVQKLDGCLEGLGEGLDLARLTTITPEHEELAHALIEDVRRHGVELDTLTDETERIEVELNQAREHALALTNTSTVSDHTGPVQLRAADELEAIERDVHELRALVSSRDQLENELAALQRERTLATHLERPSSPMHDSIGVLVAGLISLLGMVLSVIGAEHHGGVLVGVGAGLVLGAFFFLANRSRHRQRTPSSTDEFVWHRAGDLERVLERIGLLGDQLSLEKRPMAPELDRLSSSLSQERSQRAKFDEFEREMTRSSTRLSAAHARQAKAARALSVSRNKLIELADGLGLDQHRIDQLDQYLSTIANAQDLLSARDRVSAEISELGVLLGSYEQAIASLCSALEEENSHASDHVGSSQLVAATPGELLESINEKLTRARQSLEERRSLELAIEQADEDLGASLGSGPAAQRLLSELANGEVLEWESERLRLGNELRSLDEDYERAIAEHTEAERAVASLLASEEIADLELQREALSAQLREVLEQWAVLGLASSLLDETLARYEKERQPQVIARAAELFAKVTEGRYQQLVAREHIDGARQHGIESISASGERIDSAELSQGTAEQLYLCLRLAFASTFAERSVSLPLVLDDVLVNFDPIRARAVIEAIMMTASEHQVFAFTCHPHIVEYFCSAAPDLSLVNLERVN